jgi:hypothetical protein
LERVGSGWKIRGGEKVEGGILWRKTRNVPDFCGGGGSGFDKNQQLAGMVGVQVEQKSGTRWCCIGQLHETKRENSGTAP